MFESITSEMVMAILPELMLLVLGAAVLTLDLVWSEENKRFLGWLTVAGLGVTLLVTLLAAQPTGDSVEVWGGMLRFDYLAFVFKITAIFAAAVTTFFAMGVKGLATKGEFYVLLLASTMGMGLMAASADLMMLFLAVETTSIPLYVMAGFFKTEDKSIEAGFKYLLFGAMTSAVMMYGFSLLYGFTGTTDMYALAQGLASGDLATMNILAALLLVLVGFGFKISAVPFHFWAPDVYEGSPTPVAGFLSTASKAAGFVVLARFLIVVFPALGGQWRAIIAALAVGSMTVGNLLALRQSNIKRMLAYSSIAHAGYILIGVVSASALGTSSVVFYVIAYIFTNLAAFGVVSVVGQTMKADEISAYSGLSRRSPALGLAMLVAFLSLAGMPPFGGFIAKVMVFAAAVQANLIWVAVIGIINAIIGLYYYLVVLKHVYLYRSDDEEKPMPIGRPAGIALVVLSAAIILLGVVFAPWWGVADAAAAVLF